MKKYLSIILTIFICTSVFSQSSSSYSRFGIGDLVYSANSRYSGMGSLGIADSDPGFIGINNPAGWFQLNRTRLNFDFNYSSIFLSNSSQSNFYGKAQFNGVTFSFPVSSLYGINVSIGMLPYSNVSYKVKSSFSDPNNIIGNYDITYEGSGGLTKVFAGTSYKLPFSLILGATAEYYFGNIKYKSNIDFYSASNVDAVYERKLNPKGAGFTFGLLTPDLSNIIKSESITEFRIGASLNYISKLTTDEFLTYKTASGSDTLSQSISKMKIPIRIMGGANITLSNEYRLNLDFAYQPWEQYTLGGQKSPNLRNATKISAGFEYKPLRELGQTFWEQIIWRSGLSFESTQYIVNGEGINQYSVMGGFSFPISDNNTIDVGLMYAMRGKKENNLFKEDLIKLNVSFNFSELWFIRQEK